MPILHDTNMRLQFLFLSVGLGLLLYSIPAFSCGQTWPCGKMEKINEQKSPDYKKQLEEEAKKGCKKIAATSCYRSPEEQRQACIGNCGNPEGCPDLCAPPGKSNHQKVATADLQGIPGDVKAGCEYLFDRCQTLRADNPSMGCEIGGYGPGAHHFAFGPIKNSAYNQCAFLKPKMGQDPSAWKKQKDEGDKLYDEVMGNPSGSGSPNSGIASSGNAPRGYSSPSRQSYESPSYPNEARHFEAPRKNKEPEIIALEKTEASNSRKTGKDQSGNTSNDSQISNGYLSSKSVVDTSGKNSIEVNGKPPGAPFSNSITQSELANSGAPVQKTLGKTNEALTNFAAGAKGGLGNSNVNIQGSEVANAVKNLANDLGMSQEHNSLSGNDANSTMQDGVMNSNGEDLFSRCHSAHVRCLRNGCVRNLILFD